jgi:predicted phage terminase large subunit-like protein
MPDSITPENAAKQARAELARRSLAHFVRQMWHVIEPSTPLVWNWHIQLVCDRLQKHLERKTKKQNFYIGISPGSMKSTIVSVAVTPWMWTKNPAYRGGFFSGNEPVALRDSLRAREIIKSDWYQKTFEPKWDFAADQDAKGLYKNTAGGFRYASSSGSRVTGLRFDDIFVDDPNDAQEIYSDAYRRAVNLEWWPAAANRLSDMRHGRRTLIMQRLHEDDFAGHVMENEPEDWDKLIIRSTAEENDAERDAEDLRKPGELLFPERFPQSVLDGERVRLRNMYDAQHQMRPQPLGGGMLKPGLMREVNIADGVIIADGVSYKRDELQWFATADIASSTKTSADNTAICIGARFPDGRMLIEEMQYGRWEVPHTRKRLIDIWLSGRVQYIGVETANAGIGIIQDLRAAGVSVKELKAEKDKVQRATPLQIALDSGRVYRPDHAPWFVEVAHEMAQFPTGKHDDCVDACAWLAIECASRPIYIGDAGEAWAKAQKPPEPVESTYEDQVSRAFGD